MKSFAIMSILALATSVAALPAADLSERSEVVERWTDGGDKGGDDAGKCNNNQNQVCCASVLGLTCLIDLLGGSCSGGSYCCDSGNSAGGLINIDLLNCAKIL